MIAAGLQRFNPTPATPQDFPTLAEHPFQGAGRSPPCPHGALWALWAVPIGPMRWDPVIRATDPAPGS